MAPPGPPPWPLTFKEALEAMPRWFPCYPPYNFRLCCFHRPSAACGVFVFHLLLKLLFPLIGRSSVLEQ